jgi:hypothetical protein
MVELHWIGRYSTQQNPPNFHRFPVDVATPYGTAQIPPGAEFPSAVTTESPVFLSITAISPKPRYLLLLQDPDADDTTKPASDNAPSEGTVVFLAHPLELVLKSQLLYPSAATISLYRLLRKRVNEV